MAPSLGQRISNQVSRIRNRQFLDSAMAAAALVASADKDVRLSEQMVLDQLLERLDDLRIFDVHTAVDLHRAYVEQIVADPAAGSARALRSVAQFRGQPDRARVLVLIGIAIAKADSQVTDLERAVLSDMCERLGLESSDILSELASFT